MACRYTWLLTEQIGWVARYVQRALANGQPPQQRPRPAHVLSLGRRLPVARLLLLAIIITTTTGRRCIHPGARRQPVREHLAMDPDCPINPGVAPTTVASARQVVSSCSLFRGFQHLLFHSKAQQTSLEDGDAHLPAACIGWFVAGPLACTLGNTRAFDRSLCNFILVLQCFATTARPAVGGSDRALARSGSRGARGGDARRRLVFGSDAAGGLRPLRLTRCRFQGSATGRGEGTLQRRLVV